MQCHTEGVHSGGEKCYWYTVQEDSQEKNVIEESYNEFEQSQML